MLRLLHAEYSEYTQCLSMRESRGKTRGPDPPPSEKSQNIGFPSNTGPDPLKLHNLPSQHSLLGHHRLMMAR